MGRNKKIGFDLFDAKETPVKLKRATKKSEPVKKKKKKRPSAEGMTQLEAFEQIIDISENCQMEEKYLKEMQPYLKVVADKQEITENQAMILLLICNFSAYGNYADMVDICRHIDIKIVSMLKYVPDFDALVERHFINKFAGNPIRYDLTVNSFKAITENKKVVNKSYRVTNSYYFFRQFYQFWDQMIDGNIPYEMFVKEIRKLFSDNQHIKFCKELVKLTVEEEYSIVLTLMCAHFVYRQNDNISAEILNSVYNPNDENLHETLNRDLDDGDYYLIANKFIQYSCDSGFKDKTNFELTKRTKKILLSEFKSLMEKEADDSTTDIISAKSIKHKELFYEDATKKRVDELAGLISEKNYKNIIKRLKERKMRSGFAIMFYGSPGTGKTETALQLARETGRDILQVNISEIKSMWVGESEKNIKAIFDRYNELVNESKLAPILLFNEADALINKRYTGGDQRAVEKMENACQNILLQGIEDLGKNSDGKGAILIATTNLETNFDKAFERRFLYKLKFDKPGVRTRFQIWKSMISDLTDEVAQALAEKFDFSGGQIENISRRYSIESILYGQPEDILKKLTEFCNDEKFEKETRKIGFNL